jgi:hypothetical protein
LKRQRFIFPLLCYGALMILYGMTPTSPFSFSAADAQSFRPVSTKEWQKIWSSKTARELQNRGLSKEEAQFHLDVIHQYLSLHPGNPRLISLSKLKRFVIEQKTDIRPSLIVFYNAVARSEQHVTVLNAMKFPQRKKPSRKKTVRQPQEKRRRTAPRLKTKKL